MTSTPISVSIVIPIFNEEGNIRPLIEKVTQACQNLDYEILAIDDGSTDNTPRQLKEAAEKNSRLRIIRFRRNFGQTAAMAAGVDHAKGNVIVPLDADGQNDPADIPRLLARLEEGYDVVSGWRKDRKDPFLSRRLPSMIANGIISYATGVRLHDYGCTLKAYRRSALQGLQLHGEMHRFLPAWCAWQGARITELPVGHYPRTIGKSKYGIFRTFKVMIDLITVKFFSGYLAKPNYLFSGTGMVCLALGFVAGSVAVIDKLGPNRIEKLRIPLLLLSIFFALVAVFLVLMGLLAELIVRLYFLNGQQKPYRLVDE